MSLPHSRLFPRQLLAVISILSVATPHLSAQEQSGFTIDLRASEQSWSLPSWLNARPVELPAEHAVIGFEITPPASETNLAATFYFTEASGGFLRVYWKGAKNSEMLSENLYEGIGMANQRTLLIKRSTLSSSGTLYVQSSEQTLNLMRVHFEWTLPVPVSLADTVRQTMLVNALGNLYAQDEVDGIPVKPKADEIGQTVVTAVLADKPERIEDGVEFTATLQSVPQFARLEAKLSGVLAGKAARLWINGTLVGDLALELPDLNDPGYNTASDDNSLTYTGWRKGSIYIPATLLVAGENRFQFAVQDATTSTPIAVKDLMLQLKYNKTQQSPTPALSGTTDNSNQ